jgi:septum formation protein
MLKRTWAAPSTSFYRSEKLFEMPAHSPQNAADCFFVLASGSPRRQEFMELLALPFIVVTPSSPQVTKANNNPIDETPLPDEIPPALVQRLSRVKAKAVTATLPSIEFPNSLAPTHNSAKYTVSVIAADTIVVLADKILGKPSDPNEATQMLKQLREQYHLVYSGLTVAAVNWVPDQPQVHISRLVTRLHQSKVWMRPYTDTEIDAYVASGDPLDKAGAYGIQNKSFAPVARLEGCFASVMGLPLGELATALAKINISLPVIGPLCTQYNHYPCCQK